MLLVHSVTSVSQTTGSLQVGRVVKLVSVIHITQSQLNAMSLMASASAFKAMEVVTAANVPTCYGATRDLSASLASVIRKVHCPCSATEGPVYARVHRMLPVKDAIDALGERPVTYPTANHAGNASTTGIKLSRISELM
jgi:hypothetical protein